MSNDTRRISWDSDWRFNLGDIEGEANAETFDDSLWRTLDLPHDFMIELERNKDNPSSGGGAFYPGHVAWYRKHFHAPKSWRGKRVFVEFEGVYHNAELWLNKHCLGRHPYGYTSFAFNLNKFLKLGKDNVLSVRVDVASDPHTRWYSGAGIYRHVWLTVTEPIHIEHWGTYITTPKIGKANAVVNIRTTIVNTTFRASNLSVKWLILGPNGKIVAETKTTTCNLPANERINAIGQATVKAPKLWSPEKPHLYQVKTEIKAGNRILDTTVEKFGIRSISASADKGFLLNGKPTLMYGGNVHHDCGPLGSMAVDRAEERKVELLKANGFNAVRCSHNPPSPAFLDACDRLGMLVMDEAFDVWQGRKRAYDYHRFFDDWWQRDLESMLYRDRNHPSIVMWSIGNELMERDREEGYKIAGMLANHVRKTDPTRPVTAGICGAAKASSWIKMDALFKHLDVSGYNYQLPNYELDHKRCPNRVVVATETFPAELFNYWKAVEKLPCLIGDFVWTAIDYLGEAGIGRTRFADEPGSRPGWPWNQANCGDIDLCGWKRPQSYYRDVVWDRAKKPYIAVHPPIPKGKKVVVSPWGWHDVQQSWNWTGAEGQAMRVDVYFNCDEIQLTLNGKSIGRKPATARTKYIATFKVPYKPGRLEAVAYNKGRVVARSILTTTGKAAGLRLTSDRSKINAD
ncbi:MAG: glycoside hydrolase family 2 protein, partial [Lentisphaerae bacterium]|nr:glycoside hydrolase family 2 protein [Lentisphaerota bacterium]